MPSRRWLSPSLSLLRSKHRVAPMSARRPLPAGQVIDLLSSSPLQQPTKATDDPFMSSPPLPSLGAVLRQFNAEKVAAASAKTKQVSKDKAEKLSIWSIPDDAGEGVLPPTRKKRAAKVTDAAAVKKPRAARKTVDSSNVEKKKKKAPLKDGKLNGRVVKSVEMKSKYFTGGQSRKETVSGLAVVPKSPSKQPTRNQPLQWTPVKDVVLLGSSSPLVDGGPRKSKRSIFDDIVGEMRYSTNPLQSSREVSVSKEDPIGNGLRNKRSIEVIGLSSAVTATKKKPHKLPKPKKKAKTITDQSPTQFRSAGGPIQVYFAMDGGEGTDPQKTSRKPGPPAKKKRKSSPEVTILLSPTSARERFDDQDFVFGTCSQLEGVGDDEACDKQMGIDDDQDDGFILPPPSTSVARRDYLKTLAKERKGGRVLGGRNAENDKTNAGYGNDVNAITNCVREQAHQDARQRGSQLGKIRKTAGGLWDAAARDPDGELMSVEVVDMTGSDNGRLEPELSRDRNVTTGSNVTGRSVAQNEHLLVGKAVRESSQVQTIESSRDISHSIIPRLQSATAPPAEPADNITVNPSIGTRTKVSTASEQTKLVPVVPDFQSYPTTKLKVEVAKFGFKDMKTRDRMVSCLEKCWEAKNKAATAQSTPQQPGVNAGPVENTAGLPKQGSSEEETELVLQEAVSTEIVVKGKKSPKRKSSKSKKPSTVSSHDDDKLDVTGLSAKPSPRKPASTPKRRSRKSASPKRRSRKSVSPKFLADKKPRDRKDYAVVCDRISKAVRKSGQTESISSFYHAILMYDPIVLEDMVLWLNTKEELKGFRIDEEMVKAWCEANGVCCVKNKTFAGTVRKRF